MKLSSIALGLVFAAAAAGQTFIQMSDPQFGMFSKNQGFEHETVNFDFAIATANRLKPAFVVITGDLINDPGNAAQSNEFHRIARKLDPKIKLYVAPGNHDVGNEPTADSLATYRERFGADYFMFREGDIAGIVLNSSLEKEPKNVPEEAAKMEAWLKSELEVAKASGAKRILVFQHISLFLKDPDEADQYFNIPGETRKRYLKLLHDFAVEQVFAGHYHRNSEGRDGALDMVTTGPVGMPLEGAKSGIRIVTVNESGVTNQYYDFGELPETLTPPAKQSPAAK